VAPLPIRASQLRPRRLAARATDRFADAVARRLNERAPAAAEPFDREAADNAHLELLLGWLLREEDNCVDVGANQGRFLWHFRRRAPRGRHVAFEPIPALVAQLRETFPEVDVHHAAVSDRAGEAEFVLVLDDNAYSGLRERSYPADYRTERIVVPLERLDEALPSGYVPRLIKVDVEGAELQVFRGGIDTITRHRPVIAFEHGAGAADAYGTHPEDVWDLLAGEARLRLFDLDARGPLGRDDFVHVCGTGECWNYLALP
jgi:FkbM family methyltransferase